MRKEQRNALVEFAANISDDELRYIGVRLVERLMGDVPDVLQHIETRSHIHEVFSSANSGDEIFAMINVFQEIIQKEALRRKIVLSIRPLQQTV